MKLKTRKILDKSFTSTAYCCMAFLCLILLSFLTPIIYNGANALIFTSTIEHDKFLLEVMDRPSNGLNERIEASSKARGTLYDLINHYEKPDIEIVEKEEAPLNKAFEDMLANLKNEALKLKNSLDLKDHTLRNQELQNISKEILKPYIVALGNLNDSLTSKHEFMLLENILLHQKDKYEAQLDTLLREIAKENKITMIKRTILKRNLSIDKAFEDMLSKTQEQNLPYKSLKKGIWELLGPATVEEKSEAKLMRSRFGQTRMDMAKKIFEETVLHIRSYANNEDGVKVAVLLDSKTYFKGTEIDNILKYMEINFEAMMQPKLTFYWGFIWDNPYDSNIFGGIYPMILGTFYLTLFSMLFAAPLGIIAAIYLVEYANQNWIIIRILRICIISLAGVPSIVFGLFGLAFLINTLGVSSSKSVLAGSMTLALLILPTIISSSEEAIKSVPNSYREAALGLGATKWRMIKNVIIPASLPSMLTGIIISMGRAAGETAPIIFTAATSTGAALAIWDVFTQATPALPWNIYNICSEHEMADRVAHVQYGMVFILLAIVLTLNFGAIVLRAKLSKKLSK